MAFKYRTRDFSREINPFTGEPWRTPVEFFHDAAVNSDLRQMSRRLEVAKAAKLLLKELDEDDD